MDYSALAPEELVSACASSGDELAWAEFIRRFQPLIASVVLRVARQWGEPSPQVIDDMIQETYLKLCVDRLRLLQGFKAKHKDAIFGYIKVFTANLAQDQFKSSHAEKRGGSAALSSIGDGEQCSGVTAKESTAGIIERNILVEEVAECLRERFSGPHSERDRRIFWLYYRTGLSASSIAALPSIGLSTKGVESTILRLTRFVRRELAGMKERRNSGTMSGEGIGPAESL